MRFLFVVSCLTLLPAMAAAESTERLTVRGQDQPLHLYGRPEGTPVVVASGDGGWIHLGPEVAEFLAGQGCFVVGVDSKRYLSSFTTDQATLRPEDVPGDFRAFADRARGGRDAKVLLVGVSEGAGLAVLAASNDRLRPTLLGVIGLGLPDRNELGWRFKDALIYVTKGRPNEPTFSVAEQIPRMDMLPLATLHSTHDEFVPVAEARRLISLPGGPKRLWVIDAANHRFSGKTAELQQRLLEAVAWVRAGGR
jgi:dienelactone hydrolase